MNTFSYYDAELEAEVSPAEAFVSARFADAAPLALGDMEQIMETSRGGGFSDLDSSPENQRRMAADGLVSELRFSCCDANLMN